MTHKARPAKLRTQFRSTMHTIRYYRLEDHLLFAAFLVVVASLVVVISIAILNRPENIVYTSAASPQPTRRLASTEQAQTPAFTAHISNVGQVDKKDPAFTLPEEMALLTMTISITNTSSGTQQFLPSAQLFVRDEEGTYAPLQPSIYVENPIQSAELKPGESTTGTISFGVNRRAKNPLLYIDTGWESQLPIIYEVQK